MGRGRPSAACRESPAGKLSDMRHLISFADVELTPIRSRGPGGQNVNKVSSAVHLRFDVAGSSLPEEVKQRLLGRQDRRVTEDGVIVIKAQASRSLAQNKADALARLQAMVDKAVRPPRVRKATRPTRASTLRRLEAKKMRSALKAQRAGTDL